MLTKGARTRIVAYHNKGLLAAQIADKMGLPFGEVIGYLRTRAGYPGQIPKYHSRMLPRPLTLPRVKCLEE